MSLKLFLGVLLFGIASANLSFLSVTFCKRFDREACIDVTQHYAQMVKDNKLTLDGDHVRENGDPWPGSQKVLVINYSENGKQKTKEFIEGEAGVIGGHEEL